MSTSREQAKQRRLNGETIKDRHRRQVTLEDLPLFASEIDISVALMGPGRYSTFRAIVPLLERRGFPQIDGLMGGRYTPAVRAFFDREYGIHGQSSGRAVDGPERFGSYQGRQEEAKMKFGGLIAAAYRAQADALDYRGSGKAAGLLTSMTLLRSVAKSREAGTLCAKAPAFQRKLRETDRIRRRSIVPRNIRGPPDQGRREARPGRCSADRRRRHHAGKEPK